MKDLQIIWGNWQHGQDLLKRWIFTWFNSSTISKRWEIFPDFDAVFTTPISETKAIIELILQSWFISERKDLINLSWIMSTSPEWLWVENMHFMFGPSAEKDLKLIEAWISSKTWKIILENANNRWIQIIESSREEHDKKVAITQWLTHLLTLISLILIPNNELLEKWKAPIWTINDMVNFNEFSLIEINSFIYSLSVWTEIFDAFLAFVRERLTEIEIDNFWTPNFLRVAKFCRENKFILDNEALLKILELDRHNFLWFIREIRSR